MSLFNEPAARPHPRAIVQVVVDGVSLSGVIAQRLINLIHTDNRGFEADTIDLDLDDADGALDLPAKGAVLELSFGWKQTGLVSKGRFTVAEVAHNGAPDVLSIRATSADLGAGLTTQRERSWHATTLGAIVRTIADENGLVPLIHTSLAGEVIEHLDQTNESSANLLTRLGQRYDAIATVKDGRLMFIPVGGGVTASGKPIPAAIIRRQSGDRHQFLISDRNTYQAVRALYHDVNLAVKGEVLWGDTEDSNERGSRPAATVTPAAGQYKTLATTYPTRPKAQRAANQEWKKLKGNRAARAAYVGIKAKYNDRNLGAAGEVTYGQADDEKKRTTAHRQAERDAARQIGTNNAFERTVDNVKTLRHVYANKHNALRAARAEWRRLLRGMATFSITMAEGDPTLFPETPVTVTGWKPQIDSTDWLIIKVTNTIAGDGGYTQRLEFEIKATEIPD